MQETLQIYGCWGFQYPGRISTQIYSYLLNSVEKAQMMLLHYITWNTSTVYVNLSYNLSKQFSLLVLAVVLRLSSWPTVAPLHTRVYKLTWIFRLYLHSLLVPLSKSLRACKCKCLQMCCDDSTEQLPLCALSQLCDIQWARLTQCHLCCVVLCVVQDPWQAQRQAHSPRRAQLDLHSHHRHHRLECAAQRWGFTQAGAHQGSTVKLI